MWQGAYSLCDIVDDDGAVGVPVVHRCQRLVAFLASSVPDLKLYRCALIEGYRLCKEGCADGGLPVVIELILETVSMHSLQLPRLAKYQDGAGLL